MDHVLLTFRFIPFGFDQSSFSDQSKNPFETGNGLVCGHVRVKIHFLDSKPGLGKIVHELET